MKSKISSLITNSLFIFTFALIAAEISTIAFENVLAQESAITLGNSNNTIGQNISRSTTNSNLAYAQGEDSRDIYGPTDNKDGTSDGRMLGGGNQPGTSGG